MNGKNEYESPEMDLITHRTAMQKLKLDVHAAQILERVAIRKKALESLLEEELKVSSRLLNLEPRPGSFELETAFEQRLTEIDKERRLEDVNCWRDLTHVMRDFLSVLEALEAAKARERLLRSGPELDFKYERPGKLE